MTVPTGGSLLTELAESTSPVAADILYLVDDVSGTPTSKKVLLSNLIWLPLAGGTMSGDILMGNNDIFNAKTIGVGVTAVTGGVIHAKATSGEVVRIEAATDPYLAIFEGSTSRAYIKYLTTGNDLEINAEETGSTIIIKTANTLAATFDTSQNLKVEGSVNSVGDFQKNGSSGMSATINFNDGDLLAHEVVIEGGIITTWNVV